VPGDVNQIDRQGVVVDPPVVKAVAAEFLSGQEISTFPRRSPGSVEAT
jgi:hypothetical protein